MSFIPQDALAHIVTIHNVLADAIAHLLERPQVSEALTIESAEPKRVCNVDIFVSSTGLVDFMVHAKGDPFDIDDHAGDVDRNKDFLILTGRYCTVYNTKNRFYQKLLLSFF